MPIETPSLFADVIQDHLELKRKNSEIEPDLPIDRYKAEDPFDNHPLFKSEEQARIEETMDGEESLPLSASSVGRSPHAVRVRAATAATAAIRAVFFTAPPFVLSAGARDGCTRQQAP